jgi:hypothetical protein
MVIMVHPNGCVHNVADEFVDKFRKAGWVEKTALSEPSTTPATEQEKPKRQRKK